MEEIIRKYYSTFDISSWLVESKIKKFKQNSDIMEEFAYWIDNKKYMENGTIVEGYTAKQLADLSRFLDGEGAFMLLIELRINPIKAKKRIEKGFVMK